MNLALSPGELKEWLREIRIEKLDHLIHENNKYEQKNNESKKD